MPLFVLTDKKYLYCLKIIVIIQIDEYLAKSLARHPILFCLDEIKSNF